MNQTDRTPKLISAPTQLAEQQFRFAGHIRDPEAVPGPGDVEDRRMDIYRTLFFNNLKGLLAGSFPVVHKILGATRWEHMIRDFMRHHRAHTPLFPELPREFLQYLQETREAQPDDPAFMLELAHYEWVELAVAMEATDLHAIKVDVDGDLLTRPPRLSPLAWQVSYHFPVHHIRPDFQPSETPAQPSHLLVYRRRDDTVHFMQLQPISARLFHSLKENPLLDGRSLLEQVATQINHAKPEQIVRAGLQELENWRRREVILGTRP